MHNSSIIKVYIEKMDERKVTCSPTKISSSYLEELRVEDPDFSVSECSENVLLLRKV